MGFPSTKNMSMTFDELRHANVKRCEDVFHRLDGWSETDWACALAGEVGELCNLIKKRRRGEPIELTDLASEAADIVIYLDLLTAWLGIELTGAIRNKFNEVSLRRGSAVRL